MIERCYVNRTSIDELLIDRPIQSLTEDEWTKMKTMCSLLKPCKDVTTALGGEQYVSSSITLPLLAHLVHLNKDIDEDAPGYVKRFKSTLVKELEDRMQTLTRNMFLKCATALDPRHKSLKCLAKDQRKDVWTHLTMLLKLSIAEKLRIASATEDEPCPPPATKRFAYENDSDSSSDEDTPLAHGQPLYEAQRLIKLYQAHSTSCDCEPLEWWKVNQSAFAPMHDLALKYLSCPATSVPSERLFSKAGNIISKKRSSLLPENANKLICLSSWL